MKALAFLLSFLPAIGSFQIESDANQDPPLNFDPASDVFAPPIYGTQETDADTCSHHTAERRKLTYSECKSYASHLSKSFVGFADASAVPSSQLSLLTTLPAGCSLRLDDSVFFNPRKDAPSTGNTGYCKSTVVSQCLCRRLYKVTDTGCAAACTSTWLTPTCRISFLERNASSAALLPLPTEFPSS